MAEPELPFGGADPQPETSAPLVARIAPHIKKRCNMRSNGDPSRSGNGSR
jgi:hypothetical protein